MMESDSVRDFLNTIEDFVRGKAEAIAAVRRKLGLAGGLTERDKARLKGAKGLHAAVRHLVLALVTDWFCSQIRVGSVRPYCQSFRGHLTSFCRSLSPEIRESADGTGPRCWGCRCAVHW